jgi:predicted metal-dependent HD superfamily phosphohydrolase
MPLSAQRWLELWQRLGVLHSTPTKYGALADEFVALKARYDEKHRHYHTAHHIAECLAHFDEARELCEHAEEVEIALWFHDAIYNERGNDNEAQSAAWAERVMLHAGLDGESAQRVHALIMATCHNALPETRDEQVLVDIDLAILGAAPARFDEYEAQVRAEYSWVPEFVFKRTRRKILDGFLARTVIYSTPHFRGSLENKARENLARSLAKLDG